MKRPICSIFVGLIRNAITRQRPESHLTLSGGVFGQRVVSEIPAEIGAQASSEAVRRACSRVLAAPILQEVRPWKVIQTSQRKARFPKLE